MFMYSYCSVCSVPGILFYCIVLCIVCVSMCTVLLPPGVNPIAVNKYIVYHIMYHIIYLSIYLVTVIVSPALVCWATRCIERC